MEFLSSAKSMTSDASWFQGYMPEIRMAAGDVAGDTGGR